MVRASAATRWSRRVLVAAAVTALVVAGFAGAADAAVAHARSGDPSMTLADRSVTATTPPSPPGPGSATAVVYLDCSLLWATVWPPDTEYALRLTYVHVPTDRRLTLDVGPLTGPYVDRFGDTEYAVAEAEVRIPGRGSVAHAIPERCLA